uniref:Elongation factor (Prokaryotic EFP homologue), putative n=1 Tax=Theileria annulata TaxID=5874 RepID=A0A3B0MFK4_THEAN
MTGFGIFSAQRAFLRCFTTFSVSSLRQGMVFLHQGKYCEVVSFRQLKQGRGSSSIQLEYMDLMSRKVFTQNYPINSKVEKVDLERHNALVQYVDEDAKELIVSDHNFEDKSIDLSLIGQAHQFLSPGDEIQVYYHSDNIVKVTIPNHILSKAK